MKVRTNLPLLMETRNLSVSGLAKLTGINRPHVSYMARGRMVPTNLELESICNALGVTSDMVYPDPELRKALAE